MSKFKGSIDLSKEIKEGFELIEESAKKEALAEVKRLLKEELAKEGTIISDADLDIETKKIVSRERPASSRKTRKRKTTTQAPAEEESVIEVKHSTLAEQIGKETEAIEENVKAQKELNDVRDATAIEKENQALSEQNKLLEENAKAKKKASKEKVIVRRERESSPTSGIYSNFEKMLDSSDASKRSKESFLKAVDQKLRAYDTQLEKVYGKESALGTDGLQERVSQSLKGVTENVTKQISALFSVKKIDFDEELMMESLGSVLENYIKERSNS